MLSLRTLWLVLAVCLPNLLWFSVLRAVLLRDAGPPRLWANWVDFALPIGSIAGVLIFLALRRVRQPAEEGAEKFPAWMALSAESCWFIDPQLRVRSIDCAPDNPLHAHFQALAGKPLWEIARQSAATVEAAFARRDGPIQLELQIDADGPSTSLLSLTATPALGKAGELRGFHAVAREIGHPQHLAGIGLHEAALRAASEPVLITDSALAPPGPHILFANPAFCVMSGYTSEELLGNTPRLLQGPGTERRLLDQLRAKLSRGETVRMETMNYRKSGEPYYVAWQISPIHDEAGKVSAFIGVFQDTTERRRSELALRDSNLRLEDRVRERTRDLEHALRELDAFSFSVSHDLRAPLRIVEGFADILAEDYGPKLDTLGNDHLKRIRNAAARMNQMIASLLSMAQTTAASLERERVDLSSMAAELLADLARDEPARETELVIAPGISAEGDRVLLRVVLQNLLANAWKFSASTPGARIEFGARQEASRTVYFVRDNGAGFDMKYVDRLFGVFQRLHSQSEFPGTGIGLATVQRIVRRHGGLIWAEASVGGGATFHFTLGNPGGEAPAAGERAAD